MIELVAADIGGTHARFALAAVADGRVVRLDEPTTLRTDDYIGLDMAWQQLRWNAGGTLPRAAAIAVASPVGAGEIRLTNNCWRIDSALLGDQLGIDRHLLINDFGAVAHAIQHAEPDRFAHLCGPDEPLPATGSITICGPGTGLGVAQLLRSADGYQVIAGEGGHIGFAPSDDYEDRLVARLRRWHGRASAERVCSGPAILAHLQTVADERGWTLYEASERAVWDAGLDRDAPEGLERAAIDRFCQALGSVAGDLALAQGAKGVVIAGGLGLRLRDRLQESGFAARFVAKGRFQTMLQGLPVKLITHPQPGLFGAAAAFAVGFR